MEQPRKHEGVVLLTCLTTTGLSSAVAPVAWLLRMRAIVLRLGLGRRRPVCMTTSWPFCFCRGTCKGFKVQGVVLGFMFLGFRVYGTCSHRWVCGLALGGGVGGRWRAKGPPGAVAGLDIHLPPASARHSVMICLVTSICMIAALGSAIDNGSQPQQFKDRQAFKCETLSDDLSLDPLCQKCTT